MFGWEPDLMSWGCVCLGMLIGAMVAQFIVRLKEFTLGALSGSVGVLSGAGVIGIFKLAGTPTTEAVWWYPIGLLIGATVISLLSSRFADDETARKTN